LKKLSSGSNILFLYVSGALILFVIFRLFRKKKTIPENKLADFPIEAPRPPLRNTELTQQEIFNYFKDTEGLKYTAYPDAGGFSIGLGHFIKPNESYLLTKTLTQDEVLALFNEDIKWVLESLRTNVKVSINKNQKLALMSLIYNIGPTGFKTSNLLKKLNEGNYSAAAGLFPLTRPTVRGVFSPTLAARRRKEQALFNKLV
jgi:lysozyme